MPEVKFVERNQEVKASESCELQTGAPWGLVRTTLQYWDSNPSSPHSEYSYSKNGKLIIIQGLVDPM